MNAQLITPADIDATNPTGRMLAQSTDSLWLFYATHADRQAAIRTLYGRWLETDDRAVQLQYVLVWNDVAGYALELAHGNPAVFPKPYDVGAVAAYHAEWAR